MGKEKAPAALQPLYQKLDYSQANVRLIELECGQVSGPDSEPVECKIIKVRLGMFKYESLSYTRTDGNFGADEQRVPLNVSGHTIYIPKALDVALRHLRQESLYRATAEASTHPSSVELDRLIEESAKAASSFGGEKWSWRKSKRPGPVPVRSIWVDALCINPDDLEERSYHVRIMPQIYSQSARLLIWIGGERDNSDLAMDLICQVQADQTGPAPKPMSSEPFTTWQKDQIAKFANSEHWYSKLNALHGEGMPGDGLDPPEWIAYSKLISRPYWSRLWAIQAFISARSRAIVGCGSKWIPWSAFALAAINITFKMLTPQANRLRALVGNDSDAMGHFRRTSDMVAETARGGNGIPALIDGLRATKSMRTTLPVDRIYAILGLYPGVSFPGDYSKSPEDIFKAFVRLALNVTDDLGVLTLVRHPQKLNLPSWCPDFTCEDRDGEYNLNVTLDKAALADRLVGYKVGLLTRSLKDGPNELRITGFVYDKPIFIAPPWRASGDIEWELVLRQLGKVYQRVLEIIKPQVKAERNLEEELWRTLVWNRGSKGQIPLPGEFTEAYKYLMNPPSHMTDPLQLNTLGSVAQNTLYAHVISGKVGELFSTMKHWSANRRLFATSRGLLGSGPMEMEQTDLICVLYGSRVPVILRRPVTGDGYIWVGPAYVHGIMLGDALPGPGSEATVFKLV